MTTRKLILLRVSESVAGSVLWGWIFVDQLDRDAWRTAFYAFLKLDGIVLGAFGGVKPLGGSMVH